MAAKTREVGRLLNAALVGSGLNRSIHWRSNDWFVRVGREGCGESLRLAMLRPDRRASKGLSPRR